MRGLAVLFGLAAGQKSSVTKVIQLLDGLKAKVEKEITAAAKDQEEYESWCIAEDARLKEAIANGKSKVDEYAATGEAEAAKAATAAADLAKLGPEIAALDNEGVDATKVRKEENKVFVSAEGELQETIVMLGKAYSVLKRSLPSFLQGDNTQKDKITEVVRALGQIIEASSVATSTGAQRMKALLEETDDLSLLAQPQATSKNYESHSGQILDAIDKMEAEASEQLSKLRGAETKSRHAYEILMQDLKGQKNTKETQVSNAKSQQAEATSASEAANSKLGSSQSALDADETEFADKTAACKKAAADFEKRSADAKDEIAVIGQAKDILSGKFAFVQVKDDNEDMRAKVSDMLRSMGRKYHSYGLLQAAESAEKDAFVKVRGMIEKMIAALEKQAADEAAKEKGCKTDIAKGTAEVKAKKSWLDQTLSRLDAAKAKSAQLKTDVSELKAELKELASAIANADKIRADEASDNAATIKDSKESVEAISNAVVVLEEYYGKKEEAFLQVKQPTQGDAASAIIEILRTAQEDFNKILQDTTQAEEASVAAYNKLKQEGAVTKAKKEALVEGKTQEIATLKVSVQNLSDDAENGTAAYEAAMEYLKTKKEECSNKAMSYEERKSRREAEISGLQEALEILAAPAFVQTGFMARKA